MRSSSSLGKVTANSFQLMVKIRDSIKDFNPNGLDEYVDSLDEEGTKRAASQIRNIHKKISDFVVTKLKANYGKMIGGIGAYPKGFAKNVLQKGRGPKHT